jgi:isopenicillin-N N-acyltransferase-like protein
MALLTLELTGDPRERGLRHGRLLRDEIRRLWSGWVACGTRQDRPRSEAQLLSFTGAHRPAAQAFAPHVVAEIDGIGEGSGLGSERAFALSCWDELCSWFAAGGGVRGGGCTSFAARRPGQGFVIGQNQDAWTWWRPVVVLSHRDPAGDRPDVMVASHPGVVGVLGVNAAGLAIVANSMVPTDRDAGVPFSVLLRAALHARDVAAAVRTIGDAPRATGANWVVATAAEAVDLETTRTHAVATKVLEHHAHSNHYLSQDLTAFEDGIEALPDTEPRVRRMTALLQRAGQQDRGVATLLGHLCDHDGQPTAICRHPAATIDDMETLAATVIEPGTRTMTMTDGPPCISPAERFELHEQLRPRVVIGSR